MSFLLGNALGANPISHYSDTRGRRAGLILSLTLFGIFGLLSTLSMNVYVFMILRLCQGLLFAGIQSTIIIIINVNFRMRNYKLGTCL